MNALLLSACRPLVFAALLVPRPTLGQGVPLRVDRAASRFDIAVKATVGSFTGHLRAFTADVTTDPDGRRVESASFRCDFTAISTGNDHRNRDMDAWQETGRFPQVSFVLTSLESARGGLQTASGRLRLHGVERTIQFPVSISSAHGRMIIDGDATLDTRDFGLPIIRKFWALTVNPVVHVHFHLEGDLPARARPTR